MTASTEMTILNRAVKKLKNAEIRMSACMSFDILTQPLASAKSAIDHMKKNRVTSPERI